MKSAAFFAIGVLLAPGACAAVDIALVPVGNAGNAADTTASPPRGSVAYPFSMGAHEVTNEQYAEFLNAVARAGDPHSLWDALMESDPRGGIVRNGTLTYTYSVKRSMGQLPVTFVTLVDTCRFCNWLHHGQKSAGNPEELTESGSYDMGAALVGRIVRTPVASYVIPTVDEWHKAAWHDPISAGADTQGTANYWAFPTGSDAQPTQALATTTGGCANPGPNVVNFADGAEWGGVTGALLRVGAAGNRSHYGAWDMAGNASEFALVPGQGFAWLGGHARSLDAQALQSGQLAELQPFYFTSAQAGFRVALIEPQSRYVPVGSPGNPGHPTQSWGSVASSYFLGRWEVTNSEWIGLLNAVATGLTLNADPHDLFDPAMASDPRGGITRSVSNTFPTRVTGYQSRPNMADKPVNFITYYDALRYCNWLHHGQQTGPLGRASTEFGAYTLTAQAEAAGQLVARRAGARFWLPSLDEWFKGAYYLSRTQSYRVFPVPTETGNFPNPALATSSGGSRNPELDHCNIDNRAEWGGLIGHLMTVGASGGLSSYGAYDMGGNVQEWTATPIDVELRVMGGHFGSEPVFLATTVTSLSQPPGNATATTGLRVAAAVANQDMRSIDFALDPDAPANSPFVHWILTASTQYGARYELDTLPGTADWIPFTGLVWHGTGERLRTEGTSSGPSTLFRIRRQ